MRHSPLRAALLASAAAIVHISIAQAEAPPSAEQLYRMLNQQQQVIQQLEKSDREKAERIRQLERRASDAERELQRTRQGLAATGDAVTKARRDADSARKEVRDSKLVMATKADVDRAKAELGTQPTQSVFRLDPRMGWMAHGDFIYFRPSIDTIGFRELVFGPVDSERHLPLTIGYDPGFRVGAGYRFGNGMDVQFAYTFLRASSRRSSSLTGADVALGIDVLDISASAYPGTVSGTLKYSLDYDTVDFTAGVNFMVGSDIHMRGFAGLRYVRIDQKLEGTLFENGLFQDGAEGRSDFWGIGPRLGLSGKWDVGGGFHVFGHIGGSLAIGTYKARTIELDSLGTVSDITERTSAVGLNPGVDASIGFGYTYPFSPTMAAFVKVGYHFEHWFNTKRFVNDDSDERNEVQQRFSLDGFFVRVGVKW